MYVVLRYRFTHTHTRTHTESLSFSLSCVLVCQPLLSHSLSTKKSPFSFALVLTPFLFHPLSCSTFSLLLSFSRSYIWFSLLLLVRWTIYTACERDIHTEPLPFYLRIYCSCCHAITKSHLHFLYSRGRQDNARHIYTRPPIFSTYTTSYCINSQSLTGVLNSTCSQ